MALSFILFYCLHSAYIWIQLIFTERRIRDAKPESKTWFFWDSRVKGLGVRVTPNGTKSFVLFYRSKGRKHLATLARTSEASIKSVRESAGKELAAIRAGEPGPLERQRKACEAPTINDGLNRFFEEYAPDRNTSGSMKQTTVVKYRNQADNYLRPALGKRLVSEINRIDIENMAKRLKKTPVLRNRVLALTSRLFNLFEVWEWRPQHTNPVRGILRTRETPRDRILTPDEIATLSKALTEVEAVIPVSVASIRVAALSGLRISEVLAIRWQDVDFKTGRLIIPESKTGRRTHDLPTATLSVISDCPKINSWVFASRLDSAVTYRTVRKHFAEIASQAGLKDIRLHDLRRTVLTRAAASGAGAFLLRDMMGHRTMNAAIRYVRNVGDPVRELRERMGSEIAAIMEGQEGEVVPLQNRNG